MKIKFIKNEDLEAIKSNIAIVVKEIIVKDKTLAGVMNSDSIIKESNVEVDELSLDMSAEKPELTDFENIKRVYNNFNMLTPSQATDERIWVAYALDSFKDYMKYRWGESADRYFFAESARRSLIRQGIGRLWWIGHLTIDHDSSEPYKYLEYAIRKQDIMENILGRNFSSNKSITKGIIGACIDCEKEGTEITRNLLRELAKYINLLGGIHILDAFTESEIHEKSVSFIKRQTNDKKQVV